MYIWLRAMHLIFNVDYWSFSRCDDFQVRFIVCLSCPLFCVCFYYVLVLAVCFRAGTRLTVGRWNQSVLICNGFQVCVCLVRLNERDLCHLWPAVCHSLAHAGHLSLWWDFSRVCVLMSIFCYWVDAVDYINIFIVNVAFVIVCLSHVVWVHKRKKCFYVLGRLR